MSANASAGSPVARVSVLSSGEILLDGRPTSLAALDETFAQISVKGGAVWYYRENAATEPSADAMSVIQLVVKHHLPISMSAQSDFSDVLDAAGHSSPRKP